MATQHSTGRGGAGNIGVDDTVYTDGGITREGPQGFSTDQKEYSTGRGGRGNIGLGNDSGRNTPVPQAGDAPAHPPVGGAGTDPTAAGADGFKEDEYVPEPAMRTTHQADFHTGRGGQGNVHKDKYGGHSKEQKEHKHHLFGGAGGHNHGQETSEGGAAAQGEREKEEAGGLGGKIKKALGMDK